MKRSLFLTALVLTASVAACRGGKSEEAPFHLLGDMDWQPKYQAQQKSPLFADGRVERPLVQGVVAQGHLDEDDAHFRGKTASGDYIERVPFEVTKKTLERGQERFNIYCAPCHDQSGHGRGMVVQRGYPPPVDLSSDAVRTKKDGEIFGVISHGVRNMPSYRTQISVDDRWAIVSWVRVLGRSQSAKMDDVPAEMKGRIEPEVTP